MFGCLLVLMTLLMASFVFAESRKGPALVYCSDDDMKIASDNPSDVLRRAADTGESVAEEYRKHKDNGNIFYANRLGEELARPILSGDPSLFEGLEDASRSQIYFLYGLAVRKALSEEIDVTILADTVMHSFQESVEDADPSIYEALTDSVADTIYRLCLSDHQKVGDSFAMLCGHDGDSGWASRGGEAYARFGESVTRKIRKIPFQPLKRG